MNVVTKDWEIPHTSRNEINLLLNFRLGQLLDSTIPGVGDSGIFFLLLNLRVGEFENHHGISFRPLVSLYFHQMLSDHYFIPGLSDFKKR